MRRHPVLPILLVCLLALAPWTAAAEETSPTEEAEDPEAPAEAASGAASGGSGSLGGLIEELTYEQQPGLPPAASKIFFSKKKFAVSGYGEFSNIGYLGEKDRSSGDLELYNTNLYRFVAYTGYKPADWLVLYAEVFGELYHDGLREVGHEVFIEVFADLLIHKSFNLRMGSFQIPMGYMNNNDEPIQYFAVNRAEVERLIVPSTWIDLGVKAYGSITPKLKWLATVFQGVDGDQLIGGTWIRRGREMRFHFRSIGGAAQLNYKPVQNLTLSASGLLMQSGKGEEVEFDGDTRRVRAPTGLLSGYARWESGNWTLMALGAAGWMNETELLYELTGQRDQGAQVLGARTYGYYLEVGHDILPYLRGKSGGDPKRSFWYRSDEMKLPLFARYERLDTHAAIDPRVIERIGNDSAFHRNNLDVLTVGANFNPRRNLVLKANYQFRRNRSAPTEGDRLEMGLGFIF